MGHKFILRGLILLLSAFSSVMASGLIKKWPVGSLARSVDIKKENLKGISDDLYYGTPCFQRDGVEPEIFLLYCHEE